MRPLCHLAAGFGTPTAGFGALPTVVHVSRMFFALGGAGFADVGAKLTHIGRVCATTGHKRDGGIADFSTVTVEPDAVHHHHYVLF